MPKLIGDKPLTAAERTKRWREKHPDRAKEVQSNYKINNPGASAAASRRFYARNAESQKIRSTQWRSENRDAVRKHRMDSHYRNYDSDILRMNARRAKVKAFLVIDKDAKRIMSQPCVECGVAENLHLDHIIPLSRGGQHAVGNLQMLCASCNLSKNNKTMIEWRAYKMLVAA